MRPVTIGIVGCGNISDAYFRGLESYEIARVVACADLRPEVAAAKAAGWGVRAKSVDRLLADPAIELVVNLTVPLAHADVSRAAVASAKHVYSEKPLATSLADAQALMAEAAAKGVLVGCAPDTFLGAAHQSARRLVDDGTIGRAVGGAVCVMSRGMEHWHPNPAFFFQPGGGPVLDVGPYYITELVHLLGPVARVCASAASAFPERIVTSAPLAGTRIAVEVPTSVHGVLELVSGAQVSFSASWDVWAHGRNPIEIYGTEGSLLVPDPNFFGGRPRIALGRGEWQRANGPAFPFGEPNRITNGGDAVADYRAVGVADMAWALRQGRPHRASGALALHVLEVMEALLRSAADGRHVAIESRCERPAPLDPKVAVPGRPDAVLAAAAA